MHNYDAQQHRACQIISPLTLLRCCLLEGRESLLPFHQQTIKATQSDRTRRTITGVMVVGGSQLQTRHLRAVQASHVSPQHSRQPEHFSTQRALVRLHSRVDSTVPRQQSRPREPLVAHRALIGLLTRVHFHVILQNSRPTKGTVTHRAPRHSKW